MDYKVLVKEKAETLLALPHCCQELKDACQVWLDNLGTAGEKDASKALVAELEEDVMSVDDVIGFFSSEDAINHFGAELANQICNHAKEIKAQGAVYCDCDAGAAGAAILACKDELLA